MLVGLRGAACSSAIQRAYLSYAENGHAAAVVPLLVPHCVFLVRLSQPVEALALPGGPATIGAVVRRPTGEVIGPSCLRPSGCFSFAITQVARMPGWGGRCK